MATEHEHTTDHLGPAGCPRCIILRESARSAALGERDTKRISAACAGKDCGDCTGLPDGRLCEHACHYSASN